MQNYSPSKYSKLTEHRILQETEIQKLSFINLNVFSKILPIHHPKISRILKLNKIYCKLQFIIYSQIRHLLLPSAAQGLSSLPQSSCIPALVWLAVASCTEYQLDL